MKVEVDEQPQEHQTGCRKIHSLKNNWCIILVSSQAERSWLPDSSSPLFLLFFIHEVEVDEQPQEHHIRATYKKAELFSHFMFLIVFTYLNKVIISLFTLLIKQ